LRVIIGTLLIFDLTDYPIPRYKAMTRVTPILIWKENDSERTAVATHEIYLADTVGTLIWTLVLDLSLVIMIALVSGREKRNPLYLFCGPEGRLSLWRTQMAAWTVSIGSLVVAYGLIRLEIPDIPHSLVALMGLSLATGGIGYIGGKETEAATKQAAGSQSPRRPRLSDLLLDFTDKPIEGELSIAKAQMVFWTGLMLALFVTKSALDGVLWDVPWVVVALTGMCQAGYVSPKLVRDKPKNGDSRQPQQAVDQ